MDVSNEGSDAVVWTECDSSLETKRRRTDDFSCSQEFSLSPTTASAFEELACSFPETIFPSVSNLNHSHHDFQRAEGESVIPVTPTHFSEPHKQSRHVISLTPTPNTDKDRESDSHAISLTPTSDFSTPQRAEPLIGRSPIDISRCGSSDTPPFCQNKREYPMTHCDSRSLPSTTSGNRSLNSATAVNNTPYTNNSPCTPSRTPTTSHSRTTTTNTDVLSPTSPQLNASSDRTTRPSRSSHSHNTNLALPSKHPLNATPHQNLCTSITSNPSNTTASATSDYRTTTTSFQQNSSTPITSNHPTTTTSSQQNTSASTTSNHPTTTTLFQQNTSTSNHGTTTTSSQQNPSTSITSNPSNTTASTTSNHPTTTTSIQQISSASITSNHPTTTTSFQQNSSASATSNYPTTTTSSQQNSSTPITSNHPTTITSSQQNSSASITSNHPTITTSSQQNSSTSITSNHPTTTTSSQHDSSAPITSSHPPLPGHFGFHLSQSFWGLPDACRAFFKSKGMKDAYQWQKECLGHPEVMNKGRHLLYSLPTSGGKSFVAEILLLRQVLLFSKKALLILPYISIVSEKCEHLKEVGRAVGVTVEAYFGSQGVLPLPTGNVFLAVATIEKAHVIINQMAGEGRLSEIGLVVVDEIHMVAEPRRGAVLEVLITKLLAFSKTTQIVGMSATVPNLQDLAKWLDAICYRGDFRPVPLKEYLTVDKEVWSSDGSKTRTLAGDDEIVSLVSEVDESHSVLVFCPTKKVVQACAERLTKFVPTSLRDAKSVERQSLLLDLKAVSNPVDRTLALCIPFGVAYHHAGLTNEERDLVEAAYRAHTISIIAATSTLAAGVNLPARRVIIRSPYIGTSALTGSRYKQMCGRAGRAGIDTCGEAFLVVKPHEREIGFSLLTGPTNRVDSTITLSDGSLHRLVLDVVCLKPTDSDGVLEAVAHSFIASQRGTHELLPEVTQSLQHLLRKGFAIFGPAPNSGDASTRPDRQYASESDEVRNVYTATKYGQATFGSAFSWEEAEIVLKELQKAQTQLSLEDELQLCYLVTPMFQLPPPNYTILYNEMVQWDEDHPRRRVVAAVGLSEAFIRSKYMHTSRGGTEDEELAAKRLFAALMLSQLISEVPATHIARRYEVDRGFVQTLQQNSTMFGTMTAIFCSKMEWWGLETLIGKFAKRISGGVRVDIMDLLEIPGVKAARARSLWVAGYKTIQAIAASDPVEMTTKMKNLGPKGEGVARMIISRARRYLKDQADRLVREANEIFSANDLDFSMEP